MAVTLLILALAASSFLAGFCSPSSAQPADIPQSGSEDEMRTP